MTLLLDTSILFALERRDETIIKKLKELSLTQQASPCVSFVTQVEFLAGIPGLSEKRFTYALELLQEFPVLHTTDDTAEIMAELAYSYRKAGKQKQFADLLIAAHALENKLTVISRDKDFADISEIKKIIL
jgi:predicted nucleic acid-binding protein